MEKNGKNLVITSLPAPWNPRQKIEAKAVQGQLKAVGIDMICEDANNGVRGPIGSRKSGQL